MEIKITGAGMDSYWYAGFIGQKFEVVRDANDERGYQVIYYDPRDVIETKYYVDKTDCVVVSEVPANITVLKDESLGGVEREYREVKRKADVGERIKIVNAQYDLGGKTWGYDNGEVHTVTTSEESWEAYIRPDGTIDSEIYVEQDEYLTLEQTDIVRINDERFRMVDRKATVGERVIMTKKGFAFDAGKILTVHKDAHIKDGFIAHVDGSYGTGGGEFRVLEPLTSAEPAPLLSDKPAPDQAAELIAKLTTRVASLEKRVAALEFPPIIPQDGGQLDAVRAQIVAKLEAPKSPQEIRDDIVKRAKEDLNELSNGYGNYIFSEPRTRIGRICNVEFVVNRDKRKVTAIIRGVNSRKVYAVGRAVCSPDDVFNVHLGRAISLRKALNQPIPPEYFEAPNPTEVRVGDVVEGTSHRGAIGPVLEIGNDGEENFVIYRNDTNPGCISRCWSGVARVIIIDDSRESDNAEPRKEVA